MKLTQKIIHELLDYSPETGMLIWKYRDRKWFTSDRAQKSHNSQYSGQEAFTAINGFNGHKIGNIFGTKYYAHRIIWLYVTGHWPNPEIDHKNRNPTDNRWSNLRETGRLGNGKNLTIKKNNTSGHTGVGWHTKAGKYYAEIKVNHQKIHLGLFHSLEVAVIARKIAERKYGFALGHGTARPSK